jgi:hypothetical protein
MPLLHLGPPLFPIILFLVQHPVNQDDRHLLAHAMASDLSVAWQFLSKRTIGFFVKDQTPRPLIFIIYLFILMMRKRKLSSNPKMVGNIIK